MPPVVSDEYSYSHLLGLVLNEGRARRTRCRLTLELAAERPEAIVDAVTSLTLVARTPPVVRATEPATSDVRFTCEWGGWPEHLPQLSRGRPGPLAGWQLDVVEREPEAFLQGLMDGGGSRSVNRFRTRLASGRVAEYAYPRYTFTSTSPEVLELFCTVCRRLGVDWTRAGPRTFAVTHRRSRARLDALLEPEEQGPRVPDASRTVKDP